MLGLMNKGQPRLLTNSSTNDWEKANYNVQHDHDIPKERLIVVLEVEYIIPENDVLIDSTHHEQPNQQEKVLGMPLMEQALLVGNILLKKTR
ncbi:hypothetical protein A2U01_0036767 [Trifolium medium]|uniref:Uncharacterized protein n=1 Tax=Trifolium medium TaxID=97028 RepID=A0A392PVV5_9FABA|nr:hypothetical protein [Trifolium medium]